MSEAEAVYLVRELAQHYLRHDQYYALAPNVKELVSRVQEVQKRSDALTDCLLSLDDLTLLELRSVYDNELEQRARLGDLPDVHHERTGEGAWIDQLRALSRVAELAASKIERRHWQTDQRRTARGGNINALTKLGWNPRRLLAEAALAVFDYSAPSSGTAYEGGPFYLFVNDVFEYATGLEPEANAKMIASVKEAVRARSESPDRSWLAGNWDVAEMLRWFRQRSSTTRGRKKQSRRMGS